MDEDVITDLKQFISATVSQQTIQLNERMEKLKTSVENGFSDVHQKIDDLTAFVTDAIDTSNEEVGKQLKGHERRIMKLEHASSN